MNPKVDAFIASAGQWQKEFEALRAIALSFPLTEELKWGKPCYALDGNNVALIHGFKDYCAMLFVKGSLLQDPHKLLIQQTENVQAGRQLRFTSLEQIQEREAIIRETLGEAIDVEKAGLEVPFKPTEAFTMPEELLNKFAALPALKTAFEALTPGRQKGYLLYFSGAKQAKTREARVDKCMQAILQGKGLDD